MKQEIFDGSKMHITKLMTPMMLIPGNSSSELALT